MTGSPAADLDPGATLAGLELVVRRRRAVEIDDLSLVGHWCDLQSTDPRDDPRPDPTRRNQLMRKRGLVIVSNQAAVDDPRLKIMDTSRDW